MVVAETVTLHVCSDGPHAEVRRDSVGVKWCFGCRKHLEHDFVVFAPVEPSYWGPWCRFDCSGCHRDMTVGFGGSREWDMG